MEPTIAPATVRAIATYVRQRAISIPIVLRETRYPLSEVLDLWSRAQSAARDPLIGRRAAALVPFGAFGIVEHLMLVSATLEDAVDRLIRYYPLVNEAFVLTIRKKRAATLLELHARDGTRILPAYAEFVLESIRRRIDVSRGTSDGLVALGSSPTPSLIIDVACMHSQLPCADEGICDALENIRAQRESLAAAQTTAELVAHVIRSELSDGAATLRTIAPRCSLSERTLQRRLAAEGTSFRAVLDSTRRQIATQLLKRETAKRVSDQLGFGEVRSFYRAFRRWTSSASDESKS